MTTIETTWDTDELESFIMNDEHLYLLSLDISEAYTEDEDDAQAALVMLQEELKHYEQDLEAIDWDEVDWDEVYRFFRKDCNE